MFKVSISYNSSEFHKFNFNIIIYALVIEIVEQNNKDC